MSKKRVVVAMSGGVDSSVAAAILKEEGYEVIGMMLRLWAEENSAKNKCCSPTAVDDARSIADQLDIPFYVRDYKDIFYNKIVKYYLNAHNEGVTPNPCIQCNKSVRFGSFLNEALQLDADYFATGHYARIEKNDVTKQYQLFKAVDQRKDQSYMLHRLDQKQLSKSLFPLGAMVKEETRKLAQKFNLSVRNKPDSQDLCFLGEDGQKGFLARNLKTNQQGKILHMNGTLLGHHNGLANYTVGQRKGLDISWKEALFVIKLDKENNAVIVGEKNLALSEQFTVNDVHRISGSTFPSNNMTVKIRYQSIEIPCQIEEINTDTLSIKLTMPQIGIAKGQSAVFYHDEMILGGGIIA